MKKMTMLMLVCLATVCAFGQQNLELKIKDGADTPNTSPSQFYRLEIKNTANTSANFKISAKDINCPNISLEKQITLQRKVLNSAKNSELDYINLNANTSLEFYIRVSRDLNAPLDKWNCKEVKAISDNGTALSNTILIKSLIPDPSKFN